MAQIVDLREREGKFGANAKAISQIIDMIGQAETKRRQVMLNNSVMSVIAKGGTPEEISQNVAQAILNQEPKFDTGLSGALQRLASPFAQQPGGEFTAPLLNQALREPRGGGVTTEQYQKKRVSDRRILLNSNDPKKNISQQQVEEASQRLRDNPTQRARPIKKDVDYSGFLDKKLREKFGILDEGFGEEAYNNALSGLKKDSLIKGIDTDSAEQGFNDWWDKKVEKEKGDTFQEFRGRDSFQQIVAPGVTGKQPKSSVDKLADKFGF